MTPIVFATHNGSQTLERMLDGLQALDTSRGGFHVIAVDNASTDSTRTLLDRYAENAPMTVLFEPRKGKNAALNTALDHLAAHGVGGDPVTPDTLIVFTDDDIAPDPQWLDALQRAADDASDRDLFGGAIRPRFPSAPPAWLMALKHEFGVLYAQTDHATGPCEARWIWGPNMAVRQRVFDDGHRFTDSIGPDGRATYAMGSETEFLTRAEAHGATAMFVAEAAVDHLVRDDQMTRDWVLGRARRHGKGYALMASQDDSAAPGWLRRRRWRVEAAAWAANLAAPPSLAVRLAYQREWLRGAAAAWGGSL